jgi:hypothetical protein
MQLVTCPIRSILLVVFCVASIPAEPAQAKAPEVRTVTFDSRSYHIDRIYRSMQGPIGRRKYQLVKARRPQLLWITGIRTQAIDPDSGEKVSDNLICHANLNLAKVDLHRRIFQPGLKGRRFQGRLFTLSQGQMNVQFPPGFGMPILSNEEVLLDTQALNLNRPNEEFDITIRTTISYVVDSELETPMKPLFQKGAQGMVLIKGKDGYYGVSEASPEEHGPGCALGSAAGGTNLPDSYGREFSAHWQVQPGREVNRTLVTEFMAIPYDTTVHFVAVHLHPFAQSLELRDLTTDTRLFISYATPDTTGMGLKHVETISVPEGVKIYADHEYELVSVYENTTDDVQDSMAVMMLYMLDRNFVKPKHRLRERSSAP